MFFISTGLTAFPPSRMPVVLQYRILVPDFRFTCNTKPYTNQWLTAQFWSFKIIYFCSICSLCVDQKQETIIRWCWFICALTKNERMEIYEWSLKFSQLLLLLCIYLFIVYILFFIYVYIFYYIYIYIIFRCRNRRLTDRVCSPFTVRRKFDPFLVSCLIHFLALIILNL